MTYNPNETYAPAGRPLTEEEYNELIALAPWNTATREVEELKHKINLLELKNDSVAFYMRYLVEDLLVFKENNELDTEAYKYITRIALEAERIRAKIEGFTERENRICDRLDRGKWVDINGTMVRGLVGDKVVFDHWFDNDTSVEVTAVVDDINTLENKVSVQYAIGNDDENAKEWQRWLVITDVKSWKQVH